MARGIQPGTEAGSLESKQLDGSMKRIASAIAQAIEKYEIPGAPYFELGHKNYKPPKKIEVIEAAALPELKEMGITLGCMPDGGFWFDGPRDKPGRKLLAGFEAKYQKEGGNAIERWCKNHTLATAMSPDVKYHTVMSGIGAHEGSVLDKFARSMVAAHGDKCVFHKNPQGFSDQDIFNIMVEALDLKDKLTYEQILPFTETKLSRFYEVFEEETAENRLADLEQKQQIISTERVFTSMISQGNNPVSTVWRELAAGDKAEARDVILDMIAEGCELGEIATEIRRLYC